MDQQKTSLLKTSNNRHQKGFTLLEVLIVLALLAGLAMVALPKIKQKENSLKKILRDLTVVSRDIRNKSRLKQRTFRLAFKMDKEEAAFWVESKEGVALASTEKSEKEKENTDFYLDEEEKKAAESGGFQKEEKYFKGARILPKGWLIGGVEKKTYSQPITEGMAYIYYAPSGLVESAIVQIVDEGRQHVWSLIFNPLTGKVELVDKDIKLKETLVDG